MIVDCDCGTCLVPTEFVDHRERVGVKIHQDRESNIIRVIIPFLDCDTVGSAKTNKEEVRRTSETVCECKDKTNHALLHETPKQISNRLLRRCAHKDSVTTGQRHKKETPTIARVTTCSQRHVSARVVYSLCLNRCLSAHRLGLRSQRHRHLASALSTTALPSRESRSPSVNNDFREQGMDSRPLLDKRTTAALAGE